jgi:hypothetical protein
MTIKIKNLAMLRKIYTIIFHYFYYFYFLHYFLSYKIQGRSSIKCQNGPKVKSQYSLFSLGMFTYTYERQDIIQIALKRLPRPVLPPAQVFYFNGRALTEIRVYKNHRISIPAYAIEQQ